MTPNEILIINQPLGNRGDEAAHRAFMHGLCKVFPDAHFTIVAFSDYTDKIREFVVASDRISYIRFAFSRSLKMEQMADWFVQNNLVSLGSFFHPLLRKLRPYYQAADLVVCAPGGICMGGFQSWEHLYFLLLAKAFDKPVVYYSRSIGPFQDAPRLSRKFRDISFDLLRGFVFLSLRDRNSESWANKIGVSYVSSIDTAFLEQPRVSIPEEITTSLSDKYVVFVPNELNWHFAYRDIPGDTIDRFFVSVMGLLREAYPEHKIVMLPQLCSIREKDDYSYFQKLVRQSGCGNTFVLSDAYGSDIQQTIISRADLVVGARYHTIVFAINSEVPFVALNYEAKIEGLLAALNLEEHKIDIAHAFCDEKSISRTLELISSKIQKLRTSYPSRENASSIAQHCLLEMRESVLRL